MALLLASGAAWLLVRAALAHHNQPWGMAALGPGFLVVTATVVFGLLVGRAGLVIALIVLLGLTRLADAWRGLPGMACTTTAAIVLVHLICTRALGLPLPLWPTG